MLSLLRIIFLFFPFLAFMQCGESEIKGPSKASDPCFKNGVDTCKALSVTIDINLNDEKQTIESFGASDCWTTKFIGKWANVDKKNQIADYLFSNDTLANGSPKGIGLSLWRFNIGSGSAEQGTDSGIPDDYRREECFLAPNGTYDWNKQEGQKWFLEAAKKRGVKDFLAFSLSPPVQMTQNNKAFGLGTAQLNIKAGKEGEYADFLVNVVDYFNKNGYPMKFLSPFNEPQWNWGGTNPSQEGTAATNTQIANFVKILGPKLKDKNISTTITVSEAAQWNFTSAAYNDGRGNQINDFFSPSSANYIGNVPNVENLISAHSYFTTCPENLIPFRRNALNAKNQISSKMRMWQTEFGVLGNICNNQFNGAPKNVTIDYGLYIAKVLHHDLAIANVSAWHWWLSVSPYNYSDALVYINDLSGGFDRQATKTDGIVSDSKQLWCMGNYSRFIKPGMIRVGANINTITDENLAANTQMVTAYKDVVNKKFVVVLINLENDIRRFTLNTSVMPLANSTITTYTTSASESLKKGTINNNVITMSPKSVVTLVGSYK
jgi:O-glycosyl hydrolase